MQGRSMCRVVRLARQVRCGRGTRRRNRAARGGCGRDLLRRSCCLRLGQRHVLAQLLLLLRYLRRRCVVARIGVGHVMPALEASPVSLLLLLLVVQSVLAMVLHVTRSVGRRRGVRHRLGSRAYISHGEWFRSVCKRLRRGVRIVDVGEGT